MEKHAHNFADLSGQKFNRLTVTKYAGKNKDRKAMWLCECDCGAEKVICGKSLRNGSIKSCGCLSDESKRNRKMSEQNKQLLSQAHTTHGLSKTPLYLVWQGMKRRCENPKVNAYENYGGRGITVCDRWQTFEGFYEDMGETYQHGLSIERINNDGGYCKDNCKWATRMEQNKNKRGNIRLTIDGKDMVLADACRKYGVNYQTAHTRHKKGLSINEILQV